MLESQHQDLGVSRFALLELADARNRQLLQPHVARYAAPDAVLQGCCIARLEEARAWALR